MPKQSAGLLVYRRCNGGIEVLLGHMGGPFWARKDDGAWTIPKGEFQEPETSLEAALREFTEETGIHPQGTPVRMAPIRQTGGKMVHAWALEMDCDIGCFRSNTFQMEWPKGSGKMREFAELDRLEWFPLEGARTKILKSQAVFLDEFARITSPGQSPRP